MSYRCGIGEGMRALGLEPGPPQVICDGCGVRLLAMKKSGGPPAWLLDRRAPPGWKLIRHGDETRTDFCPRCKGMVTND